MYSNRGSFAGANYTDVHTQMPVDMLLAAMALVGALALLSLALFNPELGYLKWDLAVLWSGTGDSGSCWGCC
jgi:uncharacterized membrane protein (UPF0182 family)